MLKGGSNALPGNKTSAFDSANGENMVDDGCKKEKLLVEAYTPPDPGPYPQDQPKQNTVRFTATQVLCNSSLPLSKCYFSWLYVF
jgi:intron-binding protein aquarius